MPAVFPYGSYGSTSYATFSSNRLSLLDRGFVYALAHVRGGQEMGGQWYEDGKMMHKKNTFTDFTDCSDFLSPISMQPKTNSSPMAEKVPVAADGCHHQYAP